MQRHLQEVVNDIYSAVMDARVTLCATQAASIPSTPILDNSLTTVYVVSDVDKMGIFSSSAFCSVASSMFIPSATMMAARSIRRSHL